MEFLEEENGEKRLEELEYENIYLTGTNVKYTLFILVILGIPTILYKTLINKNLNKTNPIHIKNKRNLNKSLYYLFFLSVLYGFF